MRNVAVNTMRKSEEWGTPLSVFGPLHEEFHFNLDPCATERNAKCILFHTRETDGLSSSWKGYGPVFMNPPFHEVDRWVRKAYEESLGGETVVCLLPARVDTQWWHDYAIKGDIRWIRGRIKYEGAEHNAPFPSVIVVFHGVK